jgi:microcystin-dependent protein
MSEPFLAEVKMFGFNFAPQGWAFCDGQILPINQNQSLYSLLGTTYGGDGRTSFGLPDLRSRTPIHAGQGHTLGQKSGTETVTLDQDQMPQHTHGFNVATADATEQRAANAGDSVLAKANVNMYKTGAGNTTLDPATISSAGGGQGHNNMQPTLAVNFAIALQGLFPSRN